MIGKGFYRKRVKSSFEQIITMQTQVSSTNGCMLKFCSFIFQQFPGIFGICDIISGLSFVRDGLSLVFECVYTVNSR